MLEDDCNFYVFLVIRVLVYSFLDGYTMGSKRSVQLKGFVKLDHYLIVKYICATKQYHMGLDNPMKNPNNKFIKEA